MSQNSELEKLERRWMDNPLGVTFAPLAEAYRRAGEHGKALEVLEVGLAQHPAYVPALIVQARCHLDTGLEGAAEASFRSALDSDPHNLLALKGLADICEHGARPAEAIRFLERLLDADPTHDEGRNQFARVSANVARPAESPTERAGAWVAAEDGGPVVSAWGVGPAPAMVEPSEPSITAERDVSPGPTPEASPRGPSVPEPASEVADQAAADGLGFDIEREINPFEELGAALLGAQPLAGRTPPDEPFEEAAVPGFDSSWESVIDEPAAPDADTTSSGEAPPLELANAVEWAGRDGVPVVDAAPSLEGTEPPLSGHEGPQSAESPDWLPWGRAADAVEPTSQVSPAEDAGQDHGEHDSEGDTEAAHLEPPEEVIVSEGSVLDDAGLDSWSDVPAPAVGPSLEAEEASDPWTARADADSAYAAVETPSAQPATEPPVSVDGDAAEAGPFAEPPPANPWAVWEGQATAGVPQTQMADLPEPDAVTKTASLSGPEGSGAAKEVVASNEAVLDGLAASGVGEATEEERIVDVPEGAEAESDAGDHPLEIEPDLVITETMAEVFLRQGHRALALAVYAQLVERDPTNEQLVSAVARLKAELEPAPPPPAPTYRAEATGGESVGSFLARVLSAEPPRAAAPILPPAIEPASAGAPTRPAVDSLSLSAIFGDDPVRAGAVTVPAGAEAGAESEPTFDEFFSGGRSLLESAPSHGLGGEEDLAQFNAWLRGLKR